MMMQSVFVDIEKGWLGGVVYVIWIIGSVTYYQRHKLDVMVLASAVLSIIVSATCLLARVLLDDFDAAGLLIISLAVIAMSVFGAKWLQRVSGENVGVAHDE